MSKVNTAKAALCKALLSGDVLNVKNCFRNIGLTNCAREISRMIEKPFNVIVSRTTRFGNSRYGQSVTWVDYRLNKSKHNEAGIKKMKEYVAYQENSDHSISNINNNHSIQNQLF
jgi:hypothetical protein